MYRSFCIIFFTTFIIAQISYADDQKQNMMSFKDKLVRGSSRETGDRFDQACLKHPKGIACDRLDLLREYKRPCSCKDKDPLQIRKENMQFLKYQNIQNYIVNF